MLLNRLLLNLNKQKQNSMKTEKHIYHTFTNLIDDDVEVLFTLSYSEELHSCEGHGFHSWVELDDLSIDDFSILDSLNPLEEEIVTNYININKDLILNELELCE